MSNRELIIVGDFNIDLINDKHIISEYFDMLKYYNF